MSDPKEKAVALENEDEGQGDEGSQDLEADDGPEDEGDDAGAEGVDGDDEDAEEAEGQEEVVEAAPKKKGASEIIRENKRRAQEAERRAEENDRRAREAERRAEEAERRANERRAQETEAQEQERIALMSESEKIAHYRQKDKQEFDQKLSNVEFRIWDSGDRADFRALVRDDPMVAKVKDKVEARFEQLRREGRPVSRELLANQEIALMVRANASAATTRQARRAESGVRREAVKPPKARSDVASPRTRRGGPVDEKAARYERLKDVIIGGF